jgi:transcriptional regulator with XRE-family HTH domain
MSALADASGVPVSTISRIESGKVEPTWAMMGRILAAAGFSLEPVMVESGSDQPFAHLLTRLHQAPLGERGAVVRRFASVARLAPVNRRAGVRRVELDDGLAAALDRLDEQGQQPIVSSLEAYLDDASVARSFSPVVYVNDPAAVTGFNEVSQHSPAVAFLPATTANVRSVARDVNGRWMVSRPWALLDSLASPGRQPDATSYLIDDLIAGPARWGYLFHLALGETAAPRVS